MHAPDVDQEFGADGISATGDQFFQPLDPLLRVYHILRSLGANSGKGADAREGYDVMDQYNVEESVGQQHFMSPTVFNFFVRPARFELPIPFPPRRSGD